MPVHGESGLVQLPWEAPDARRVGGEPDPDPPRRLAATTGDPATGRASTRPRGRRSRRGPDRPPEPSSRCAGRTAPPTGRRHLSPGCAADQARSPRWPTPRSRRRCPRPPHRTARGSRLLGAISTNAAASPANRIPSISETIARPPCPGSQPAAAATRRASDATPQRVGGPGRTRPDLPAPAAARPQPGGTGALGVVHRAEEGDDPRASPLPGPRRSDRVDDASTARAAPAASGRVGSGRVNGVKNPGRRPQDQGPRMPPDRDTNSGGNRRPIARLDGCGNATQLP